MTAVAGLVLTWHPGESGAQVPVLETEVTGDGLYRVDPSVIPTAWVKSDADLSRYERIFFMPTVAQFRELPERRYTARTLESTEEFEVSDLMRARLREVFGEAFYEAVSGVRSYELSKEFGRDVLMVQGFLTDVVTGVPPDIAGLNVRTVRWVWEANVVMELRDSMSGDILARTLDHARIEGPVDADTIYGLAPRVAGSWARLLSTHLGELYELYPSRLRRLQEQSELSRK